jgi:siroheme synthase (precorrin-2 oxidase/ferrochelatase)
MIEWYDQKKNEYLKNSIESYLRDGMTKITDIFQIFMNRFLKDLSKKFERRRRCWDSVISGLVYFIF